MEARNLNELSRYAIRMPRCQHYLAYLCFNMLSRLILKLSYGISCLIVHSNLKQHAYKALADHFKLKIAEISSEKLICFSDFCFHESRVIKAAIE